MSELEEIHSDILGETPDKEPVRVKGHDLVIWEMDVDQYGRFAQINQSDHKLREVYKIAFECLLTPDGQQVFDEEHIDSFMETSAADGTPSDVIRDAFMRVNDLESEGEGSPAPEAGDEGN